MPAAPPFSCCVLPPSGALVAPFFCIVQAVATPEPPVPRRILPLLPLLVALVAAPAPAAADDVGQLSIAPARYADAREALVDAIEAEGLIPSPPSRFGDMLARTAPALGHPAPIYADAEVLHFCSARIAWQLARENPLNIAQCPLSMAIYTLAGEPATVRLAWRRALGDSPGAHAADELLERIARHAADNAGRALPAR